MGVCLTDLVIESVIRDGLTAIRSNPLRLDDLFENFNEPYIQDTFGQEAINRIKSFITSNNINIVQGFNQIPSSLQGGCISINLASATEMKDLAVLSDFAEEIDDNIPVGDISVYASFTPTSYNTDTGEMVVPDSVDLSSITTEMLFQDVAGTQFDIIGGINDTIGSKAINIDVAQTVDISNTCSIVGNLDFERFAFNMIPIFENIQIGVHTENPWLTKCLYYIILYILQIRRDTFIRRGIELTSFSASDFVREAQFLPENCFSRFITLSGITRLRYKSKEQSLAENTDSVVRVQKDTWPLDNETDYNVRNTLK